ncbi:MAG: penicillin amidase, partial [Deltaproteobacteria bacterium]|nr:penicillin amidase [Deltaproteobacteria bacterium]
MKGYRKWFFFFSAFFVILCLLIVTVPPYLNSYQNKGVLKIPGLKGEVRVLRDEKGMAYIYAGNTEDAFLAHGFISAQDRLFQMELAKLYATGRICELVGEKGEPVDTRMRTIGFHRHGKRQAGILNPQTRMFFQKYLEGVNAYIQNFSREHPLEFRVAGIKPSPWDLSESLAILFFMSWNSAANLETEIVAQMLIAKVGLERAREIFPLNVNPDDPHPGSNPLKTSRGEYLPGSFSPDAALLSLFEKRPLQLGSNNWATGPDLSAGGKPIVANDPHLDARLLPGPWYPCALITPDFRMVGAGIPGIPGFVIGRNEHVASGVTNSYGDAQDLYAEALDPNSPDRYLEGSRSLPFEVITEKLSIKDSSAPSGKREKEIKIRLTRRGPVISGVLPGLDTQKAVTLRWAPFETL